MTFGDLIGQKQVIQLLSEGIQTGRIGHAYLFSGPEGIGKSTMAICFAEAITCEKYGYEDILLSSMPCGQCEGCLLNRNKTNPDVVIIKPQIGSVNVGVEDVRLVQDEISTAPVYGKYKVLIFENADKMTVQAQNALLKTLEEPPEYIVMILLSSNNSAIIDTVKSRTVRVDFQRYTDEEILTAFDIRKSAHGIDKDIDKNIICEYSDGIIGRALEIADTEGYEILCNDLLVSIENLYSGGSVELCMFENMFVKYAEKKEMFFFTMYSLFRDIAIVSRYGKNINLQNAGKFKQILKIADRIGYHNAIDCLHNIDASWRLVKQNVNYKLASDSLAIRIQKSFSDV